MAHSLPSAAARTHANPRREALLDEIRPGPPSARTGAKNTENRPKYRSLVREAMRIAGLSQKAFAIDADQPESVISDALAGRRAFDGEWARRQKSETFKRALRDLEARADGSDPAQAREESFDDLVLILRRLWFRHRRSADEAVSQ